VTSGQASKACSSLTATPLCAVTQKTNTCRGCLLLAIAAASDCRGQLSFFGPRACMHTWPCTCHLQESAANTPGTTTGRPCCKHPWYHHRQTLLQTPLVPPQADPAPASMQRHEPNIMNLQNKTPWLSRKTVHNAFTSLAAHDAPRITSSCNNNTCRFAPNVYLWTVQNFRQTTRDPVPLNPHVWQGALFKPWGSNARVQLKTKPSAKSTRPHRRRVCKGPLETICTRSAAAAGALLPRLHELQEISHASTATPAINLTETAPGAVMVQHIYSTIVQKQRRTVRRQTHTFSPSSTTPAHQE